MRIQEIKNVRDLSVNGRSVFLRLDFNVPLSKDKPFKVTDDTRITEALPTIQYLIESGAKIVIASHLGRPDGVMKPEYSLEPVALHLAKLLGQEVTLAEHPQTESAWDGIRMMIHSMKAGQLFMLENLRFHPGEEKNDAHFSMLLAGLCQVYVTDAFGTAHRKHASTYGVFKVATERACGLLIQKELRYLEPLVASPAQPFHLLLGGAKVSDKIRTVEFLMSQTSAILVGGAMAFAFWKAQGKTLPAGAKLPADADVFAAQGILRQAAKRDLPVLLPTDFVESFDIGPDTVRVFSQKLRSARTVFWNGPMGWFEKPPYEKATFAIARSLAEQEETVKIVGGGDTVSAVKSSGLADKFQHLSTGGGAALEYLEGKGLPGIEVLRS